MTDQNGTPSRRVDYRPPDFAIDSAHLDFDLRKEETIVRATLAVRRSDPGRSAGRPLVLHGEELETRRIVVDDVELDASAYEETDHSLTVPDVPDRFTLETEVVLHPEENTAFEGLYASGANYYTDLEPMGFRRITWFLDRPDVLPRFRTRIEADRSRFPVLLSNGNRVDDGTAPDGRHWVVWEDPIPKPCYLFAMVAGDLRKRAATFTTRSGREVPLEVWVEPENIDKCDYTLDCLQRAMKWDEDRFGREYDLDVFMIVAVGDFNGGAMENKGLNIFNTKYVLADPLTATDDDYAAIEGVVAHEYFHNWTGNRVTLRDWFQLTLKEGLTIYRDQEFSADMTSGPTRRIESVRRLRELQFPQDDGPMAHPVRPDEVVEMSNFYTTTVYEKGAEVIRMYEALLGRDGFRRGMDLYFERHDGQAVTCVDFLAAMADANSVDLLHFGLWYEQSGTPIVTVAGDRDEAARTYTLTVRQELPAGKLDPGPLLVPIRIALLGSDGEAIPLRGGGEDVGEPPREQVLRLTHREQTFRFEDVDGPVVPSLFRGFSAPVRCVIERSREELGFLVAHDTDPVARWDAGQELALGVIVDLVGSDSQVLDPTLRDALCDVLEDTELDPWLRSLTLGLPAESVVAQRLDTVDPGDVHRARCFVEGELGRVLGSLFEQVYAELDDGAPYALDRASIGRRSLKNVALAYLSAAGGAGALALARGQFDAADNMTDSLAAFRCLVDGAGTPREDALATFHERWKDEPLVLDKWFAVQAASRAPDTFERVVALSRHPDFTLKNPNRMAALLSTFAHRNPAHFHRPDGAAYEFVADKVLEVDALNPMTAARLAKAFLTGERLEPERRGALERTLGRLAAASLSTNTREIVESVRIEPSIARGALS